MDNLSSRRPWKQNKTTCNSNVTTRDQGNPFENSIETTETQDYVNGNPFESSLNLDETIASQQPKNLARNLSTSNSLDLDETITGSQQPKSMARNLSKSKSESKLNAKIPNVHDYLVISGETKTSLNDCVHSEEFQKPLKSNGNTRETQFSVTNSRHSGEKQKLLNYSKNDQKIQKYLLENPQKLEDGQHEIDNNNIISNKSSDIGVLLDSSKSDKGEITPASDEDLLIVERNEQPDTKDGSKRGKLNFKNLTRTEKLTIVLLAASHFSHMVGFSLMAPFFPREAQKKGISQTLTGLIFSSFELCVFISAPLFGVYLTSVGPSFMFTSGIFVAGACNILFGLLYYCPPTSFVVMCFITRSMEALGISAYTVASLAIASKTFPDNIATIFGLMETSVGLGFVVGPILGNFLYELGGYGLPFYVLGGFIMLMGLLVFCCFPKHEASSPTHRQSAWILLRSGQVWIIALTISVTAFGVGFIDPTLALHARKMGIPDVYIGLLFVLVSICYALTAPLWGWLSDKKGMCGTLIVGGNLVMTVAFLILGPSPFLPFIPESPVVILVALALFGISMGCAIMPTMKCMLMGAHDVGFEDNLDTFGMISGAFNSFYCLGSFLGPSMAGIMVDYLDFESASSLNSLLFFIATVVSLTYFGVLYVKSRGDGSYIQLPLRISSDEDSIPVNYDMTGAMELEKSNSNSLSVLALSMRAGMSRHYM